MTCNIRLLLRSRPFWMLILGISLFLLFPFQIWDKFLPKLDFGKDPILAPYRKWTFACMLWSCLYLFFFCVSDLPHCLEIKEKPNENDEQKNKRKKVEKRIRRGSVCCGILVALFIFFYAAVYLNYITFGRFRRTCVIPELCITVFILLLDIAVFGIHKFYKLYRNRILLFKKAFSLDLGIVLGQIFIVVYLASGTFDGNYNPAQVASNLPVDIADTLKQIPENMLNAFASGATAMILAISSTVFALLELGTNK